MYYYIQLKAIQCSVLVLLLYINYFCNPILEIAMMRGRKLRLVNQGGDDWWLNQILYICRWHSVNREFKEPSVNTELFWSFMSLIVCWDVWEPLDMCVYVEITLLLCVTGAYLLYWGNMLWIYCGVEWSELGICKFENHDVMSTKGFAMKYAEWCNLNIKEFCFRKNVYRGVELILI